MLFQPPISEQLGRGVFNDLLIGPKDYWRVGVENARTINNSIRET